MALQSNLLQRKLFCIEIKAFQIDQLFFHPDELNSDFNCLHSKFVEEMQMKKEACCEMKSHFSVNE